MTQNHRDFVPEIDFFFIVGGLSDTLQSHYMTHSEQIKLALCAQYCLGLNMGNQQVGFSHTIPVL